MKLRLLTALLPLALAAPVQAEDDDSGFSFDDKLQSCAACHGENGDKPLAPDYPILAGQYADYLEAALRAYRDGRRSNPIMTMQVETLELSDQDIKRLAAYFADKKGLKNLGD